MAPTPRKLNLPFALKLFEARTVVAVDLEAGPGTDLTKLNFGPQI
jgi:hypothetical protein